jgi:hypothetical protein
LVVKATVWDQPLAGFSLGSDNRRQHLRVAGPFDGVRTGFLQTPLQIFDLSLGGCFVNSLLDEQEGVVFNLKIEIPEEGWLSFKAETLYRRDGGYAVRFIEMDNVTWNRLERALDRLADPVY